MSLKIYNTLTRKKEKFKPQKGKVVKMYVCGPTVYDYDHLGHARVGVFYDIVRRYLSYLGYTVQFSQNITDVGHLTETETGEDKIEKRAVQERKTPKQIARFYEKEHFKDFAALNILKPDLSPRASDYISQIIEFIKTLAKKGYAYEVGGNVYFDVTKFKDYGKLSGRKLEEQKAGTRIEAEKGKKHPQDFALWKKAGQGHIMQWDSPWGRGYPGWHIECSVINNEFFGPTTDIHGGAIELVFPHHENEIAQSESVTGKPFVRYWLHIGLVTVAGEKMSKSVGNIITIRKLLKKYDFNIIRLALLSTHYRKPFDYKDKTFEQTKIILDKLKGAAKKASPKCLKDKEVLGKIEKALDDDFNTSLALQIWFKNRAEISQKLFRRLEQIFGFDFKISETVPEEIKKIVLKREFSRKEKNWKTADQLRKEIEKKGYLVEDTKTGSVIWKK